MAPWSLQNQALGTIHKQLRYDNENPSRLVHTYRSVSFQRGGAGVVGVQSLDAEAKSKAAQNQIKKAENDLNKLHSDGK